MRGIMAVFKKEMTVTFSSPIFYAATFIFMVVSGYFFYTNAMIYTIRSFQAGQNPFLAERLNLSDFVVKPFFGDMAIVLLLMLPLITMRAYAEEKKMGTIELLFTYPISDGAVLAGKFAASMFTLLTMLVGSLLPLILLETFAHLDWGLILSGYLGILLLGASFIALGLFTSSLTENQIIAAVLSFGAFLLFWIIGWAKSFAGPPLGSILEHISIVVHLDSFVRGLIDSRDLVFYLVFIFFWLFVTLRFLNTRFWRG
ncbi:MAG: ABC transporter permease subunit [Deltaproteobacteria bacterium]|nr:ABC transporter permease subunit [Deltaproteobacteria bacterium]